MGRRWPQRARRSAAPEVRTAVADPFRNPEALIHRVYGYVAYRLGDGPDAEDVTSEVFERALRYRGSYDEKKGAPATWLLGIARRCIYGAYRPAGSSDLTEVEDPRGESLEAATIRRLSLAEAVATLDPKARELIALRYGGELTAREIGELLGVRTNTVEVALHRALARLRQHLNGAADSG